MKKHCLLVSLCLVYLVLIVIKYLQISVNQYISSYAADVLCLPVVLSFANLFLQKIRFDTSFRLPNKLILLGWLYVSIVFEVILPHFSTRYTADIFDVVAYGIGAMLYWIMEPKMENNKEY